MNEDDLKQFLDDNAEDIKTAVRQKMIDSLLQEHRWEFSDVITGVIREFVTAEIVPEVKKYLADNKGALVKAAIAGAASVGDTLAKALVERTAKNLNADSYHFRQVMKALFD